jgi:hypothetical protein
MSRGAPQIMRRDKQGTENEPESQISSSDRFGFVCNQ